MYDSEFKALSFMGMSNPEMFLSEKDLNALELNFLARPTLEFEEVVEEEDEEEEEDHDDHQCQIAPLQEEDDHVLVKKEDKKVQEKVEDEDKCTILVSSLKIKLPNSIGEFKVEEEEEDGFKTPTSLDKKIPQVLQCPPAPRKPKSRPLITTKRKLPSAAVQQRRIILHDLSNEIEAMFPSVLLADLGNKIKKVRQEKK